MGYALAGSRVLVISGVDCRCRGDGMEQARSPGALRCFEDDPVDDRCSVIFGLAQCLAK